MSRPGAHHGAARGGSAGTICSLNQTAAGLPTGAGRLRGRRRFRQQKRRPGHLAGTEHGWRAASRGGTTPHVEGLKPLWKRLLPYALEQDSQVLEREAIVPGGTYLGRALGDHLAVAFPFSSAPNVPPALLNMFDRNRFPRPALIEAAVRFVTADLIASP
jgi:hypothetical protein